MKVIGITGSIACGKSTVTNYLLEQGYQVVDADKLSRECLFIDKASIDKVQELFGCVDNGIVDRKALGQIVFHDAKKKKQLENIIHPYVINKMKEAIEQCKDDIIFLDIPLLYESHLEYLCDMVVVVYVNDQTQLKRLILRDGIDETYAKTIIATQMSSEEKKARADYVLDNNQDVLHLYAQIEKLMEGVAYENIHKC